MDSPDTLSAYDPEWVMTASTNNKSISESYRKGTIPKGSIVEWDKTDSSLHTVAFNKREYGLVTFVSLSEQALKKGKKTSLKPVAAILDACGQKQPVSTALMGWYSLHGGRNSCRQQKKR